MKTLCVIWDVLDPNSKGHETCRITEAAWFVDSHHTASDEEDVRGSLLNRNIPEPPATLSKDWCVQLHCLQSYESLSGNSLLCSLFDFCLYFPPLV